MARLLADAGLAWRFEHEQHAGGKHTLVVFDRDAPLPDTGILRFHRIDATETLDAISQFSEQRLDTPACWSPSRCRCG